MNAVISNMATMLNVFLLPKKKKKYYFKDITFKVDEILIIFPYE